MTRIIAGQAKGLRLVVPQSGTRPTSDRVRESLFAILDHEDALIGSRVLDLFAGSGALGIEALSRGAEHLDLVDFAPAAVRSLKQNAQSIQTRLPDITIAVHQRKALSFVENITAPHLPWQLIFVDPPYDLPKAQLHLVLERLLPQIS
ncbi:MAG: RsmD family RNA methyltransferase, partial [Microbacteriaceae bacterium]